MNSRAVRRVLLLALVCFGPVFARAEGIFDKYFLDFTMRIDYIHFGNAEMEEISIDRIYLQNGWAGSLENLIDPFNNGRYAVNVHDVASQALIYSKGFDSYFGEYKTTSRAIRGQKRAYHESALIPYPKRPVILSIEVRDKENVLHSVFRREIDPADESIIKENPDPRIRVFPVISHGDTHTKVDVAFIAEGYTQSEEAKVKKDFFRFSEVLFSQEPYKSRRDRFNVSGVFLPSPDSGVDEPRRGIYKNTALGATFNSLGSERYLLTEDNEALRDIASAVPYDVLFIMVNHQRYGGGGIYNLYCVFTTDNQWHEYLILHEFGHSFVGLGDEYYTSSVAYNDFYPKGIEPLEPNITALLHPDKPKWGSLLSPGIEIPTPWEKEDFDRMDGEYQALRQKINDKIARMKREGRDPGDIARVEEESERLSRENAKKMDGYLRKSRFWGRIGAFEGAGYSAHGLYRPMVDCIMFSKGKKPYCMICEEAIIRVIDYYSR